MDQSLGQVVSNRLEASMVLCPPLKRGNGHSGNDIACLDLLSVEVQPISFYINHETGSHDVLSFLPSLTHARSHPIFNISHPHTTYSRNLSSPSIDNMPKPSAPKYYFVWYCCHCGDGPYGEMSVACANSCCRYHYRCSGCAIEKVRNNGR